MTGSVDSRRDALRKGLVATAAAGTAWIAPRVEGLTLRPDYASAQTGPGDVQDLPGTPFSGDLRWNGAGSVNGSFALGAFGTLTASVPGTNNASSVNMAGSVDLPSNCQLTGLTVDTSPVVTVNSLNFDPSGFISGHGDFDLGGPDTAGFLHVSVACT